MGMWLTFVGEGNCHIPHDWKVVGLSYGWFNLRALSCSNLVLGISILGSHAVFILGAAAGGLPPSLRTFQTR